MSGVDETGPTGGEEWNKERERLSQKTKKYIHRSREPLRKRVEDVPQLSIQMEEKVAPRQRLAVSVRCSCVYTSYTLQDPHLSARPLSYTRASTSRLRIYTVMGVKREWQGA